MPCPVCKKSVVSWKKAFESLTEVKNIEESWCFSIYYDKISDLSLYLALYVIGIEESWCCSVCTNKHSTDYDDVSEVFRAILESTSWRVGHVICLDVMLSARNNIRCNNMRFHSQPSCFIWWFLLFRKRAFSMKWVYIVLQMLVSR